MTNPGKGPGEKLTAKQEAFALAYVGGGKTWALLLEPMRHIHRPDFGAVFFRRNTTQRRTRRWPTT